MFVSCRQQLGGKMTLTAKLQAKSHGVTPLTTKHRADQSGNWATLVL